MATSLELAARRFYDMSIVKHFGWKSISAEILSSHRMEGNDVLVTIYNGPFLISSCWMEHFCQSGEQLLHPSSSSQLLFSFLLLCVSFPSSICLLSFGLCLCGGGGGVGWGGGGGGGGGGHPIAVVPLLLLGDGWISFSCFHIFSLLVLLRGGSLCFNWFPSSPVQRSRKDPSRSLKDPWGALRESCGPCSTGPRIVTLMLDSHQLFNNQLTVHNSWLIR